MPFNPFRNPGSTKAVAAKRRMEKEQSFLDSLTVRADDPDCVLDDDGNVMPIREIIENNRIHWEMLGISFFLNDKEVDLGAVILSLEIINSCAKKLTRLLGK